jgi:rhodanese-related sulfurtransferase
VVVTFPFEELSSIARQQGLVVAVLIGIAFGFVLERAGFGRADKLAAQFYLRDMRVFKVMFSAIVTAMLGLVIASGFGLADLRTISESIASFTWIWPMLAGGFVLGVGFIVSGYCPGTSVVAAASGSIDGAMTVAGVVAGTLVYSELLEIPAFSQFHGSGERGAWFLYDLLGVSPAVLAAIIAAFALLAFIGAEKVESMLGKPRAALRLRRYAFATVSAMSVVALATSLVTAAPVSAETSPATIEAPELARIVAEEPWSVRVLDVRDAAAFAKARVPGSENVTAASLNDVVLDGRPLVIVGRVARVPAEARVLAGGIEAWNADPVVKAMTTGAPPPPPPSKPTGVIAKPKKKGGGCSA